MPGQNNLKRATIAIAMRNDTGVLDLLVDRGSGSEVYRRIRLIPTADNSTLLEVSPTLNELFGEQSETKFLEIRREASAIIAVALRHRRNDKPVPPLESADDV